MFWKYLVKVSLILRFHILTKWNNQQFYSDIGRKSWRVKILIFLLSDFGRIQIGATSKYQVTPWLEVLVSMEHSKSHCTGSCPCQRFCIIYNIYNESCKVVGSTSDDHASTLFTRSKELANKRSSGAMLAFKADIVFRRKIVKFKKPMGKSST